MSATTASAKTDTDVAEIKAPSEYLPLDAQKAVSADLAEALQKAGSLRVVDDASMDEANAVCGKIRARQKGIENFRLAIVKPLKDHIAKIDRFFKELQGQFDQPLEILEEKVVDCREKKLEAARKEQEKLEREAREKEEKERAKLREQQEAARKKEEEARAAGRAAEAERLAKAQEELKAKEAAVKVEVKAPKKEAPAKTSFQEGVGRTTFTKTAEHRIDNLDILPEEFWCVDEKKLAARVRELTKELEVGRVYRDAIPGVVITCSERASYAGEK